jgi:hypothetical protein
MLRVEALPKLPNQECSATTAQSFCQIAADLRNQTDRLAVPEQSLLGAYAFSDTPWTFNSTCSAITYSPSRRAALYCI